jgi:molybdopterin synthase sulfur carrier subunit
MVTVKLFGNLRQLAGKTNISVEGETIMEVLAELRLLHGCVVDAVLDEAKLKPHYKIMVNGIDIMLSQGLATQVNPNDIIAIFPPIAGGLNIEKEKILWL